MKSGIYSKYLLLIIYLSGTKEEDNLDNVPVTKMYPNLVVNSKELSSISDDLLYIVGIIIIYGPTQGITYGEKACTGTMIRNDLVMTLASCILYDYHYDPDPNTIRIFERPKGHALRTLKIYINPNFYSEDSYISKIHDCSVLVVEKSRQTVFPRLPQGVLKLRDIKSRCIMGGYGTDKNFAIEDFQAINISQAEAELLTGRSCLGGNLFCLHFPNIMPCEADYGAALICDGAVYALYIPGSTTQYPFRLPSKCFDLYLTVFSPVNNVQDWVAQILETPTSHLEWLNNPWYVLLLCFVVFFFMGGIYCGLMEFLQRNFDLAEGMRQTPMRYSDDSEKDDQSLDSYWTDH